MRSPLPRLPRLPRFLKFLAFLGFLSFRLAPVVAADTYPRQAGIDAIHYVFRLALSDESIGLRVKPPSR